MSTGGQKLRMRTGCLPVNIGDVYSSPAYLGQHKAALVSGPSDRTVPDPRNVPWKVVAVIYPLGQSPGLSSLTLSKRNKARCTDWGRSYSNTPPIGQLGLDQ